MDVTRTQPQVASNVPNIGATTRHTRSQTRTSWVRDIVDCATEHPGEWVSAAMQEAVGTSGLSKSAYEHAGKKVAEVYWEFDPEDVPSEFDPEGYPGFRLWVRWASTDDVDG